MTPEKLNRANELAKEINELKEHRNHVANYSSGKKADYKDAKATIHIQPAQSNTQRRLRRQFLPFELDEIVEVYLIRVEKQIALLEKEFESL